MQTFAAVIQGKVVTYPQACTFLVQRKRRGQSYDPGVERRSISDALSTAHARERRGYKVRLSWIHRRITKKMVVF